MLNSMQNAAWKLKLEARRQKADCLEEIDECCLISEFNLKVQIFINFHNALRLNPNSSRFPPHVSRFTPYACEFFRLG